MVLLIIKRHTCLCAYTLCYFSLCSLSSEIQSLGHLKTCRQVPVTRKTNPNKVLITNLNRNRRFWNTWMFFLHNSKCFLYFLSFHWWPRPFHLAISSAKGKAEKGSPLPSSNYDPCRPYLWIPQSSHVYPFWKVYLFLRQILLATGRSGEEGITSDGWSGELMKGRLQGFANGASGRKICG